jgi:hypothetical protein
MYKSLRDFAVVFVVVMAIGVFADWFAAGPGGNSPRPVPVPPRPEVVPVTVDSRGAKIVREAFLGYGRQLAEVLETTADGLESGEITTAEEMSKSLQRAKTAKATVLDPIYDEMKRVNEARKARKAKWEPTEQAKLLREFAAGVRSFRQD